MSTLVSAERLRDRPCAHPRPKRTPLQARMAPRPDEFTNVYRTNAEAMLLFFQRRLHDPEQATDLLAETFAVAIERADQFRGESADQLAAWVWAIARSLLSGAERRGSVERRYAEQLGIERRELRRGEAERIEELAGLAVLRDQILELLDTLPPPQRDAVRLRMIEELDYEELAETLGVSQQTARARVSRGLRALRRQLEWGSEQQQGGWR
jgi:RNA polymerase sigma-70 factor, ECF subfamily